MTADFDRFRRPTPKWCTDVAVRLLRIGCREDGLLELDDGGHEPLLGRGEAELLVRAAAALDAYGQRLLAARA